jgi:precorrin-6Y C5,15-methyltransferase (decarboxylating)
VFFQSESNENLPNLVVTGLESPSDLPPSILGLINWCQILAGPESWLNGLTTAALALMGPEALKSKELLPIKPSLDRWLEDLERLSQDRRVLVVTGGDPNFFGLAGRLLRTVPSDRVVLKPATTTVQKAFARLKTTWAGVEVQSLHGRQNWRSFWTSLYRAGRSGDSGRLAVYTDPRNTPTVIAKRLLDRGQEGWEAAVLSDLGTESESVWRGSLSEAAKTVFPDLNLLVLTLVAPFKPLVVGASEEAYAHFDGLITKSEVRSIALGLLELTGSETMWDLGCGSGSVALEAARLLDRGEVWAVEKNRERSAQAFSNRAIYGAAHLEIIQGDALEVIDRLPQPDRVFVGGGGASLSTILSRTWSKLAPNGVIVASAVRIDSLSEACNALSQPGRPASVTQVAAARSEPLTGSLQLKPQNQVWLIKGRASKEAS